MREGDDSKPKRGRMKWGMGVAQHLFEKVQEVAWEEGRLGHYLLSS